MRAPLQSWPSLADAQSWRPSSCSRSTTSSIVVTVTAQTFAVLAHDAVYGPGAQRGDNETLSAQLMRVYAPSVDVAVLDAAFAIIIETTDHVPRHAESTAVLDLDLMRLGAAARRLRTLFVGSLRRTAAVDRGR